MAKKKQSWEDLLEQVNKNLKGYGAQLVADNSDEYLYTYTLEVHWTDGKVEEYASGYADYELAEVINEAWDDIRCKAREQGNRIIRCIVHVDTDGDERFEPQDQRLFHEYEFCGNEEEAVRFMNRTLPYVLDDHSEMQSVEDLPVVNAALARQYDEPYNLNAYASIEDITEEVVVKCSELFCEHHWSHKALCAIADDIGIDLYDIEKN